MNDTDVPAFDAKTGKILWEFDRLGVAAVPVSAGRRQQYIAVQSGWGVDPAKMQARMNSFPGQYPFAARRC
jgi:hypothetical protein